MIKMFYALLLGVFLMLSLDVSAGPLSIISTEIERDASYARIATNAEYLVIVARKKETVGWPDAEPQLLFQERIPEYTRNVLELPNGRYRMTISNIEITLDTQIQSSTSQYQREAQTEEEYHERQLKGLVSISDGGCGDLFDVENAMRSAGFVKTSNGYIRDSAPGQSRALFEFTVLYDVRQALASEIDESRQLIDLNRGYMEKCAKEAAGYNAAFRYHCTYGHRLSGCLFLGEEDTLTARTPR